MIEAIFNEFAVWYNTNPLECVLTIGLLFVILCLLGWVMGRAIFHKQ